jgi:hypothetical protein
MLEHADQNFRSDVFTPQDDLLFEDLLRDDIEDQLAYDRWADDGGNNLD